MYNLTNVTNATTTWGQITAINETTGGLIGTFIIIILFVLVLLATIKNYGFQKSLFGASFLTTIVSMLLFLLGWITIDKLIVPFLLLGASTVAILFTGD